MKNKNKKQNGSCFNVRFLAAAFSALSLGAMGSALGGAAPSRVTLSGNISQIPTSRASRLGHLESSAQMPLIISLRLQRQDELNDLLRRLYDPKDHVFYGKYLTPAEFAARFAPNSSDCDAVTQFVTNQGLSASYPAGNCSFITVHGLPADIERAFGVQFELYKQQDGTQFFASSVEPSVPGNLAQTIKGIIGLDNAAKLHHQSHALSSAKQAQLAASPMGTGPGGAYAPADIKKAYGLNSLSVNGSGQVLALIELDGYHASDIQTYVNQFQLSQVPLQNVLIDGVTGTPSNTPSVTEVTLDIELMNALAPGASKIMVYEGPNTDTGVLHIYQRIANDNQAKSIGISWAEIETQATSAFLNGENTIFQQMAAQGQSTYAASGDTGAYPDGVHLAVWDPSSQPYVVGVGGTTLTVNSDGSYNSESTWNKMIYGNGAGGGGISSIWSIPSWQAAVAGQNQTSSTMRNVPDVSLNSDPTTGYSIYSQGQWVTMGGTSCAAPLWAAFTALVNQQRQSQSHGPLGFGNPLFYQIGLATSYSSSFHDVMGGSNQYYFALMGYDNATGWGSFQGAGLFASLTPSQVPAAPTGLSAQSGLGVAPLTWNASSGALSYNVKRSTQGGAYAVIAQRISGMSFNDSTVTRGQTYNYVVSAVNAAGESANSSSIAVTP